MACPAHRCRPWARYAPTWCGGDQGGLTSKKTSNCPGRGPLEYREASLVSRSRDGHLNPKLGVQQVVSRARGSVVLLIAGEAVEPSSIRVPSQTTVGLVEGIRNSYPSGIKEWRRATPGMLGLTASAG